MTDKITPPFITKGNIITVLMLIAASILIFVGRMFFSDDAGFALILAGFAVLLMILMFQK